MKNQVSDVRKEDSPAIVQGGLSRAIWALEGPHIALGNLLQGHLAQDVPTGHQHGRIVRRALLPRHRAGEN